MKIGIEIHQRLEGKKLFCDCDSVCTDDKPLFTISRQLHPVFSELGETDAASQAEFAKGRTFQYQVFKNNCMIETDEEPPKLLSSGALGIALNIAGQLHAAPVDEVHIMRKMVIDGSNTSGFQRTAVIAFNGHLESSRGIIRIPQIAIEEESAGIVSSTDASAVYRLDRLGVPLIEITTDPDIKDGAHLLEVAEKLGMILRASGKVARGLGTIRQDVNISTDGGARVEIKGAQDLKLLPTFVDLEARRQLELLKLLTELRHRKAFPIKKRFMDVSSVFAGCHSPIISTGLKSGGVVLAQPLPQHNGLLGREIQPGRRYGTELSDYAKRAGVKGLIHGDETLSKYAISDDELALISKALSLGDNDSFILVIAPKVQAEQALSYAIDRANMDFIPEETRRANPDGTSSYMRPLPGKGRLYPETDVPPIPITKELLGSLERSESLDQKKTRLEKQLNKEMAARILRSRNLHLFEHLVNDGVDPMLAATTLEETLVSLRRDGIEFSDLEDTLRDLFAEYRKGTFVKAAIPDVLRGMIKGARAEAVVKVFRLGRLSGKDLETVVAENDFDMKKIMQKYRLQVDAQEVAEIIKKK